jgi:hypothetical protein
MVIYLRMNGIDPNKNRQCAEKAEKLLRREDKDARKVTKEHPGERDGSH